MIVDGASGVIVCCSALCRDVKICDYRATKSVGATI